MPKKESNPQSTIETTIQSLVLPTDDPGDTPDCMCEYGPLPVNMATHAINQPIFRTSDFFLELKLHLAFLVRPEPPNSYGQSQNMANSA